MLVPAGARAQTQPPQKELPRAPVPARVGVTASASMDLSLDEAVTLALKNNADIAVARLGAEAADYRTFAARGA